MNTYRCRVARHRAPGLFDRIQLSRQGRSARGLGPDDS